ncbi:hypothetical protein GCM10010106_44300 [Thermopolyspora flexuosa]|uniref:Uncharacterized protein n=1 Tax=Thermopolyspora flexuosa TaxID=103836 RepID=A0A543IXA3_9ACTN|nr:DUF6343 family protein [Thermopolyspora flexuosa]TQM75187.1 hypothetical protein FHX40_1889 [Thermopolyspora flexuosa]GGM91562.1 hypothetical protein GCM10010106_44300 [Thermopolyspora flexuosa]
MGFGRNRSGTEPVTARSPLRARAVLSGIALPVALIAAVYFVVRALREGDAVWWAEAIIAGAVAVIAAIDLLVLRRRMREAREAAAAGDAAARRDGGVSRM